MKIEMDERGFWLSLWVSLAVVFWIGIAVTCAICSRWDQRYIEAGYTRAVLPGRNEFTWVKL